MSEQHPFINLSGDDMLPLQTQLECNDHHFLGHREENSGTESIASFQSLDEDSQNSAAMGSHSPQDPMTLETGMLSGIGSNIIGSVAMLSLGATEVQDNPYDERGVKGLEAHRQDETYPPFACIHEGPLTNVYCLRNQENKHSGKTNAVAVKVLSEQFPEADQIARLENERRMSTILCESRCGAVRAAVKGILSRNEIEGVVGKEGNDIDSSRVLYLEWLPGLTLGKWLHTLPSDTDYGNNRKKRLKILGKVAWKIAHSLAEIHETGGVVLNNISSENIIVNFPSNCIDEFTIHMISLGSASFIEGNQNEDNGCKVRQDLCSLGEVFFELFSGESPLQSHCKENAHNTFDGKLNSVVFRKNINRSGHRNIRRPLKELRAVFSSSEVPSQLAAFILEVMGVFGSSSANVFDASSCGHYYYKSAKEVREKLYRVLLEPELPTSNMFYSCECLFFNPDILHGREEQQSILLDAFKRVILEHGACEVVLVTGFSGAGKTAFVKQTLRKPVLARGGHFLHVKFDQLCQAKPLFAMLAPFLDFCKNFIFIDDKKVSKLVSAMEKMVGNEGLVVLAKLLPPFCKVVGSRSTTDTVNMGSFMAQKQLIFVFQAFVRVITGPENPIILFLDDMQWADTASLHLLRALIMDSNNNSLLFVESYRENEVIHDSNPFSIHISDVKDAAKFTKIRITNLKEENVNELLSNAISEPLIRTQPLSNIVYRKTSGNVLLVIQFIKSLWDEGQMWFSFYEKKWTWEIDLIESRRVLEDAAALISQKILYFPSQMQSILKTMACFGSRCEISILHLLGSWQKDDVMENTNEMFDNFQYFDVAVREGIVNKDGPYYKFVHDQIQQAAYALIPEYEQSRWHLKIGMRLLVACTKDELDESLFVVVDQLNRGKMHIEDDARRIKLAELNCKAGEKAKLSGVFSSAALYLEHGISLLNNESWCKHYLLWLCLYTSHAEMEFCNGNFEKATIAIGCIITHARCFDDKLRAYRIMIFTLGAQKRLNEAITMGLEVLGNAGEHFPTDPDGSFVEAEFLKACTMLEGYDVDTLVEKAMNNKQIITIMEIFESLILFSLYDKPFSYLPLFSSRMVQLSVKHGFCESTMFGIAVHSGITCGLFGDVQRAVRYAELTLDVMERTKAYHQRSRVCTVLYSWVLQRRNRLDSCIGPILLAYRESVDIGDTGFAIAVANNVSSLSFQSGKELSYIENFLAETEEKAIKYQQMSPWQVSLPLKQAILNFMGKASNPALLEGEAINFNERMLIGEGRQNKQVVCRLYLYQMQVAYMFGDLELAMFMASKSRSTTKLFYGKFEICEHLLYDGLISFAKARGTNKNKWKTLALESMEKMKRWSDDAPCNCRHKLHLLEAEHFFLVGKTKEAINRYKLAIKLSGENGFIQDRALSYERTAAFYLENGEILEASAYYGKAHNAYILWGAEGKADHLRKHSPF